MNLSTTQSKKKTRKQRVVNNAVVEVNNISAPPGINYVNWISITKEKLKKRESSLFSVKIAQIESVANKELSECKETFSISQQIINHTLQKLYNIIDEWQGVNMSRRKKPINRYRDYFCIGKNWFDQSKKKIIGTLFWDVVFKHIHNFLGNCNKTILETKIILALFEGKVKYSNTKPLPIINGGSVMCSNEMHKYLSNLDNTLKIKEWITQQEDSGNHKNISKIIVKQIRTQLHFIVNNKNITHNNNQNKNYNNNHNIQNNNQIIPQNIPQNNQPSVESLLMDSINRNNNNANNNNYYYNNTLNSYNAFHVQMHSSVDYRYSPLACAQNQPSQNNNNSNLRNTELPLIIILAPMQMGSFQ